MIIAVDTRFLSSGRFETGENYAADLLLRLATKHPAHRFLFIADKPIKSQLIFPKNITVLTTGPQITNSLLMQYWFNYKLPSLLKKHKADLFVGMDGICSLRTKIAQCILINDTSFLSVPAFFTKTKSRYYKKHMPAFVAKAKAIATTSEFSKSLLTGRYKESAAKIEIIVDQPDDFFSALKEEEKEMIKAAYTDGKEYFLSIGTNNPRSNLVNLLKAFSFFKRRQKSNMLLLLAGNPGEEFITNLKTYKFRNEVTVLPNLSKEALVKLTAAAYAFVWPVLYQDTALAALQAMQCRVPVITSAIGALPELCGDAALYINPENFEDMAQKMMLVFKDEDMAKALVKAGAERLAQLKKNNTDELFWAWIKKAANS